MKVLVAIEDKLFGDAIADFVANHEWPEGSELLIIHVLEPIFVKPLSGYPTELIRSLNEERERAGRSLILGVGTSIRTVLPDIKMKEELVHGRPKEVLLDKAREWPADLIVMGSHGRGGIGQFFLGSTSMSVLSAAPCSVMVVKLRKEAGIAGAQETKNKEALEIH